MQLFFADRSAALRKEKPHLSLKELHTELAEQWGKLGVDEQQVYQVRTQEDKERYSKEMEEFRRKYPAWEKPRKAEDRCDDTGKQEESKVPSKRVRSTTDMDSFINGGAFLWFAHDKREELHQEGCHGRQAALILAKRWEDLPKAKRQVFATIFQKAVKVVDEARKVEEIAQKGSLS
eukprot:EG_transcript_24953